MLLPGQLRLPFFPRGQLLGLPLADALLKLLHGQLVFLLVQLVFHGLLFLPGVIIPQVRQGIQQVLIFAVVLIVGGFGQRGVPGQARVIIRDLVLIGRAGVFLLGGQGVQPVKQGLPVDGVGFQRCFIQLRQHTGELVQIPLIGLAARRRPIGRAVTAREPRRAGQRILHGQPALMGVLVLIGLIQRVRIEIICEIRPVQYLIQQAVDAALIGRNVFAGLCGLVLGQLLLCIQHGLGLLIRGPRQRRFGAGLIGDAVGRGFFQPFLFACACCHPFLLIRCQGW